jgi:adenylate kinase family enzyme
MSSKSKTSDSTIIKRLSKRRQCSKCGAIYGIDFPPQIEGICTKCGTELYQRNDDKEEAILNQVNEGTVPDTLRLWTNTASIIIGSGQKSTFSPCT